MADELTPEGLAAWRRSMDEIERRSRAMAEGMAQHWQSFGSPPAESEQ